jgi:hypothetical protein
MSKWSALYLTTDYERCVIGFDWRIYDRKYDTMDAPHSWLFQKKSITNLPASVDNLIWTRPSWIEEKGDFLNGLNLFDYTTFERLIDQPTLGYVIVAFDLPRGLVDKIQSTFQPDNRPIEDLIKNNWIFLGYDVIDVYTQSSGLYSFNWSDLEFSSLMDRTPSGLNKQGLIDDVLAAINVSIYLDSFIKDHAPFAPCGVWVKPAKNRGQQLS